MRVVRERSRVGMAAVAAILLLGYSYLPKLMAKPTFSSGVGTSLGWTIASAPYVLIGGAALAIAWVQQARMLAADRAENRPSRHRSMPAAARTLAVPEMSPDLGVTRT
jgi:hypothetical protein